MKTQSRRQALKEMAIKSAMATASVMLPGVTFDANHIEAASAEDI